MENKTLFIIIGKSGAGKDFTTENYRLENPDFVPCVSDVSRPMRPSETEGVEYYFKTKEEMLKGKSNGDYWEWIEYAGNVYGFTKQELDRVLSLGKTPFVKVDSQGFKQVVESSLLRDYQIKTIFFDVPEALQIERIKTRDPNVSDNEIKSRLKTNIDFDKFYQDYHNLIDLHILSKASGEDELQKNTKVIDDLVKKNLNKTNSIKR